MEKNKVSCEAKDENGMPPLHVAMLNDQLKFAEWLLTECEMNSRRAQMHWGARSLSVVSRN